MNLYTYRYSNPVMYFDPNGTDAVVIMAIVGAVTVGGAVYDAVSKAGVDE